MSSGRNPVASSSRSTGPASLQRGRACGNCRRRKIKCDGRRPVCTQCERSARPGDECEYTDAGRTRTQTLEDNISRLEARIRELEEPHDEEAVRLHDPYFLQSRDHRRSSSLPHSDAQPHSPVEHLSPVTASFQSDSNSASSRGTPSTLSPVPSGVEPILEEPSLSVIQHLLHTFLPHAAQFGFFLNTNRFLEAALRPLPMGDPTRPCPALLTAVYLWGIHLTHSDAYSALEPVFLSRALLNAANGISSDHPQKVIHGIQASVLLSAYFFKVGRVLEGKYHLAAATSLVSGYRLHQMPTTSIPSPVIDLFGISTPFLPPSADHVEEGERINAFWTVYGLNNCWSVALGTPTGIWDSPGSYIDVPWPLDVEQYEQSLVNPPAHGVNTVENFLNQVPTPDHSMSSLFVKASVLFERASNINTRLQSSVFSHLSLPFDQNLTGNVPFYFHPAGVSSLAANDLADKFSSLDTLIESFKTILPSISHVEMTMPHSVRTAFVTHTLTHVAVIQLHTGLASTNVHSQQRTIAAAESVFELISATNLQSFGQINPILGTLWTRAAQVIVSEISRMRALRATWGGMAAGKERELAEILDRGLAAMSLFAGTSQLMGYQLTKLQAEYSAI